MVQKESGGTVEDFAPEVENQGGENETQSHGITGMADHVNQPLLVEGGFVDDPGAAFRMVGDELFQFKGVADTRQIRSQTLVSRAVSQSIGGIVGKPLFVEQGPDEEHFPTIGSSCAGKGNDGVTFFEEHLAVAPDTGRKLGLSRTHGSDHQYPSLRNPEIKVVGGMMNFQIGEPQRLQKRGITGLGHTTIIVQIAKKRNFSYDRSMQDSNPLRSLPKIELHEHLDGSLRPETILELARCDGIRLPTESFPTLVSLLSPGPSSLEVYLAAFAITTSVMQTQSALRRVAFELVEDWYHDGVVYGEVRFAPEQHTQSGLTMEEVVEAVLRGLEEGRRQYPVETGLILCSMRHNPPTLATVKLVHRYRQNGVVAFDIAGPEASFRPGLHRQAFEYCAENLLATTCHAGEVTGPDYIKEALVACRSLRIGHGTQLIQEWGPERQPPGQGSLTSWVRDRRIPLELCLSSNLQTRACADLASHPFEAFRQAGLVVTLCTDNRLVSATSLSRELALAQNAWGLSQVELIEVQKTALEAAFCPPEIKERIRAKHFPPNADSKKV